MFQCPVRLFLSSVAENAGKVSFTWFGPYPRITISDPELVRQVLANKFGHFDKTKLARLARVLIGGLAVLDGEEWAKHRRIMNPAFHAEKLKVILVFILLPAKNYRISFTLIKVLLVFDKRTRI